MEGEHNECLNEYETLDMAEDDWQNNEMLLRRYYDERGPGGTNRDYPEIGVVHDSNLSAREANKIGQLNADWVELLMGFPVGYTVVGSGSVESQESHKSKKTGLTESNV